MTEHIAKTDLLQKMQTGFESFIAFLEQIPPQRLTEAGVNGAWSVKDNLAHLVVWQTRQLRRTQEVQRGEAITNPTPGLSEEQINELYYQEQKDRSLDDVLAAFRACHQQLYAQVQGMSEEELNRPVPQLGDRPIWLYIAGNTYEHCQEHREIIERWLKQ